MYDAGNYNLSYSIRKDLSSTTPNVYLAKIDFSAQTVVVYDFESRFTYSGNQFYRALFSPTASHVYLIG